MRWDPWEEGSATNFVQFTVKDESEESAFETPFLGDPAPLSGLAAPVTIPAATLLPARRYKGELIWLNSVRESTGACPAVMAMAALLTTDVREVLLMLGEDYRQERDVPQPLAHHFGLVQVELNAPNTVTSGTLGLPNGREVTLELAEDGGICQAFAEYALAADLERFPPDGEYTLSLKTARDGVRVFALPWEGAALPEAPRLLGLGAMQAVNPTQPFQLSGDPFPEGAGDDHVVVEILNDSGDPVLETGAGGVPRLPGTATSYEIPAQTLNPGRNYEGVVRFIKLLKSDTTTYPGVQAYSVAATSTRFPMRTAGEAMRPVLRVLPAPHGAFRVQVTGEPGRAYLVEIAHILLPGVPNGGFNYSWGRAVAEGGSFELTEYDLLATPHRFYHVREATP